MSVGEVPKMKSADNIAPSIIGDGGAGFIGSILSITGATLTHLIVVVDALTYAGNQGSLAGLSGQENFRFVQGDICDRSYRPTVTKKALTLLPTLQLNLDRSILTSCLRP